jgi:DNA-binding CsgD family transcriptional regulator
LEWLGSLARTLAARPALLLLTCRDDEAPPTLRRLLADLDRARLLVELPLRPLNRGEVAAMVGAIRPGGPLTPAFLDRVAALTDGNPFFVEEVLRSPALLRPVDGPWAARDRDQAPLPRAIQHAVQRLARRVSPAARRALTLAAVAGRRFDVDLVGDALHLDAAVVSALMADLVATGLVVEETARRFAFRHALMRRVLVAELPAGERQAARTALAGARARRAETATRRFDHERSLRSPRAAGTSQALTRRPAVSRLARPDGGQPDRGAAAAAGLTRREAEVAGLLARGCANRMIAAELSVSERTVEGHVSNILAKLEFTSRAQAAVWAAERGLAPPTEALIA